MRQLVFLLEEESMKALLDELLPRLLPPEVNFLCIPHEGKSDLEKSIPIKLRAWQTPASFVIVRDKDKADCIEVKNIWSIYANKQDEVIVWCELPVMN